MDDLAREVTNITKAVRRAPIRSKRDELAEYDRIEAAAKALRKSLKSTAADVNVFCFFPDQAAEALYETAFPERVENLLADHMVSTDSGEVAAFLGRNLKHGPSMSSLLFSLETSLRVDR